MKWKKKTFCLYYIRPFDKYTGIMMRTYFAIGEIKIE